MDKIHNVQSIQVDDTYLYFTVDGQSHHIRWVDCSPKLVEATPFQRQHVEVSPSGYGLRWTLIDEDLAIGPLLQRSETLMAETA